MGKNKRRAPSTKPTGYAQALQTFRRHIHAEKNPRHGLTEARKRTKREYFPKIIQDLGRQPLYRPLLVPTAFPATLDQFTAKPRLVTIETAGELIWTASLLALFRTELKQFIGLRDRFYKAYVLGELAFAEQHLNEIEKQFGVSLWLLGHRLRLLQVTHGLKAQKDLLERVVTTSGFSQYAAWLIYYLSVCAEENVSFASLESETNEIVATAGGLSDFFLNHVVPYDLTRIGDPGVPISWDEPNPVIDRYETFVSMLQLFTVRADNLERTDLLLALNQLDDLPDSRIANIVAIVRDGFGPGKDDILPLAEAYTEGRYEVILVSETDNLELVARSRALCGKTDLSNAPTCIRDEIVFLMQDVLVNAAAAPESRLKLKKLALNCAKQSYGIQVAGFLERQHDHLVVKEYSELDKLVAITGPLDNPWSAPVLAEICAGGPWLQQVLAKRPESSALKLRLALTTADEGILSELTPFLPSYRFNAYAGHIALSRGNFASAINWYEKAGNFNDEYVKAMARRYSFDALYASHQYDKAMKLAVGHILGNPAAADSYPLEGLAQCCLAMPSLRSRLELALLLYLTAKHAHPKWERELSDVYENVLAASGVERPSELPEQMLKCEISHLIFFLRHICVPRILDDTTCFESVDEIDSERIAICQGLLQLDHANEGAYLAEIRAITRASNVAHLLQKVQTSKIFVDEAGIRQSVEPTLRGEFARYLQLLNSPALAYQAEKLSKRLSEMLNSKGHPEFKDLKLPASELEGLFESMLTVVVQEFAANPAFGLDTHVSTSIRHGAFEGHLRSPLAVEDLLCSKLDDEYVLPQTWQRRFPELQSEQIEHIRRHLGRFTQRFDEVIASYLKQKLHIRIIGNNTAMFDLGSSTEQEHLLMDSITTSTDYDFFVDKLMSHCWSRTNESLSLIRSDLLEVTSKQIGNAFDLLVTNIESRVSHERIAPLVDAIVRARTAFQVALQGVAGWFHKPTDLSRDPFDFEVAIHVALQQIANCYVASPICPELNVAIPGKIDGSLLDGLCEVLFILLQNVIIHGGYRDKSTVIQLSARRTAESVVIECRNEMSEHVDQIERRRLADEAMSRYKRDSALRMARKEGGSGLSKIWRIAEFELRARHSLSLEVTENQFFVATITLTGLASPAC